MKTVLQILLCVAVTAAVPQSGLSFLNKYKTPIKEIEAEPNPRIIGGTEAEPHSIPYQVFLEIYNTTYGWYCGGTLISENYVLTAGHCSFRAGVAHVTLGAHDPFHLEDTQITLVTDQFAVHPEYAEDDLTNDISVIKLRESVTLNDAIQLVVLPSRVDVGNTYEGALGRLSGWGITKAWGSDLSEFLQYVDLRVISNQMCEESFGTLSPSVLCTYVYADFGYGSCNGDTGGPLVLDGVQIAVASFIVQYCPPGYPNGFTRVGDYLDWIEMTTDVVIN